MSGITNKGNVYPNGPCSNDYERENEDEPCKPKPFLIDVDEDPEDEPPQLSPHAAEAATANTVTVTTTATGAANGEVSITDINDDSASTSNADMNADADVTADSTADAAADSGSNPNAQVDIDEESQQDGLDKTVDEADEIIKDEAKSDGAADNSSNLDAAFKVDGAAGAGMNVDSDAVDSADEELQSDPANPVDGDSQSSNVPDSLINTGGADIADENSSVQWNTSAEEVQNESSTATVINNYASPVVAEMVSSGAVNKESDQSDEADGAGSNTTGSTIGGVTIKENVDEEGTHVTPDNAASTGNTSGVEEVPQSFYSCSSTDYDGNVSSRTDAVKVLLRFDYDLTTESNFNSNTLSSLEDNITRDLAGLYGLISCSKSVIIMQRRRYLRKLEVDDILALDSKPADVNVGNAYECKDYDPNSICTPISGFMTAYLGPSSDEEASKAAILSHIEEGMESGAYLNNQIIKTSFIGTRSNKDKTSAVLGVGQDMGRNGSSMLIGLSVFFLGFAALVGFGVLIFREKKRRANSSDISTRPFTQSSCNEIATHISLYIKNQGSSVGCNTVSSSGDEDDIRYGITEDYGDLAVGAFAQQDITPVHPESCLAVIQSGSDLEARSFEIGTPRASPTNIPIHADFILHGILSPASSTAADLLDPAGMLSPPPSVEEYSVEPGILSPACSTEADLHGTSTDFDDVHSEISSVTENR